MAYKLGISPDDLELYLWRDSDFDSALTRTADDLVTPVEWGPDVRLIFPVSQVAWPADVEGNVANFHIDRFQTNQRSHRELVELWVGDQCWASGKVIKKGLKGVVGVAP